LFGGNPTTGAVLSCGRPILEIAAVNLQRI
jgi:hypothetical protein